MISGTKRGLLELHNMHNISNKYLNFRLQIIYIELQREREREIKKLRDATHLSMNRFNFY